PGADGLKTGFTCDSGYNVVAAATRDDRRLMAVILGESSGNERAIRAAAMLEYGFQNYDWKQLFNTSTIDNYPMDPNFKTVMSVRDSVTAWGCRDQRRHTAARRHKSKHNLAAKKKAGNDAAAADDAPAPALKGPQNEDAPDDGASGTTTPKAAAATAD
ncbi:MAG TPA: D-alanyl-D-alanine carboxypeptidase, partial [Hyphomicrobium sp.]|nr:D-alanyl-D-alanine carboxypeptidase [Hyphomicrobium sp.]